MFVFPRRFLLLLPALMVFLLVPAPDAEAAPYVDTAGTPYEEAVEALARQGLLSGCSSEEFCVDAGLQRGQFATILARALDMPLEPVEPSEVSYTDIADSRHVAAIEALTEAGIVNGCGSDRFCPGDPVSRGQLATLLHSAFHLPASDDEYFVDQEGTHFNGIASLATNGITAGCGPVEYCPRQGVTRGGAALYFARSLQLVERTSLDAFEVRLVEHEQQEQARAEQQRKDDPMAAIRARGERVVEVAMAQRGKPYRWGGSGPNAFDCSGLTSFAWRAVGVELPRTSRQQHASTRRISRSELIPGDLVFYHSPVSHVAIYIGDGKVVEAPNSGNAVRVRADGLTRSGVVGFGRPA